ncbi:hypothetical protein BASA50_000379 [Batrachochytrium salamandrivorans]|uniref:Cytochrome c oxidase subunit 6, mitochondrial n=1 Tax=Batrachochytrium salamandrivorans TaxID=1357716 RepID=A0ABQ8EU86_9FUNG|nr:hypothetical protein BASA60_000699 [Batrachochytrium salamandrivorans]KAH6586667.1 hypothetical protein BASA50_000379 [Batrachochytrium salamandrivorans]KAH6593684.1 hypothetical protein BASA61_004207 [Batrachochytrium salamandrivorans]KAH9275279.1 hypothetical protein BASA83_002514 [Batrachochytrium salamandrivorans]
MSSRLLGLLSSTFRPLALAASGASFRNAAVRSAAPVASLLPRRQYSSHELDPANKSEYDAYVQQWMKHFTNLEDDFELERGLNHIFAADWVPSVELIAEALKASRRLNTFPTAVRVLEGLEEKAYKAEQYQAYLRELKPLLEDLGIPERKDLGKFDIIRDRNPWTE